MTIIIITTLCNTGLFTIVNNNKRCESSGIRLYDQLRTNANLRGALH